MKIALPALMTVAVFAIPGYEVYRSEQASVATNESVIFHSDGLVHLTEMEAALSEEHMAAYEFIFEGLTSARDDFVRSRADVDFHHQEAIAHADTPEQESALQECQVIHDQAAEVFLNQIVPAKDSGAGIDMLMPNEFKLHELYNRIAVLRADVGDLFASDQQRALFDQTVTRERVSEYVRISAAIAVVMGLFFAGLIASRVLKPVKKLATAVSSMSEGDLGRRVQVHGHDELAALGNSFNLMADSLERRTSQLEKEKARIRSVHQSIGDGILVFDNRGAIVSVNPAGERILGRPALELEGTTNTGVPELQRKLMRQIVPQQMVECWVDKNCEKTSCPAHGSEDRRCWLQCGTFCYNQIQGTFKQKRDACERCDVFRKNAVAEFTLEINDRHYSTAVIPILDDEGQEEGSTLAMHDVTDILRAQEALERHSAELEMLNKVSEAVTESLELDTTLKKALDEIVKFREADGAFIHLLPPASEELTLAVSLGIPGGAVGLIEQIPSGRGCPGHVLDTGEPAVEGDLRKVADVPPQMLAAGLVAAVSVPLNSKNRIMGTLTLLSRKLNCFDAADAQFLKLVGTQIAAAIENSTLYQDSVDSARREMAKNRISSTLASTMNLEEVFDEFVEETRQLVDFDRISVTILDEKGSGVRAIVPGGCVPLMLDDSGKPVAENTSVAWVVKNRRPLLREDLRLEQDKLLDHVKLEEMGCRSLLNLPLIAKDRILGTLNIASFMAGAYDNKTIEGLQPMADQLALAIANQQLFEDVARAKTEWESTFDSVSEGIAIVDTHHNILRMNKAAADMVGGDISALLGQKCFRVIHKICQEPKQCPMTTASLGAGPSRAEQDFPDGRTLELVVDPMFDAGGNLLGAVHFLRDVTEAKRLRQQLLQSEKMVAVGQLVAGVAHEINNPLTGVTGYSQLLLSRDLDEKTRRDVEKINHEAERASKIVRHLLSFARKHQPEQHLLDVNQVLRETLELKAYDLRVNNIITETMFAGDLPMTTADPYQLQQVFLNLIANAEQAMLDEAGGGRFGIFTEKRDGMIRTVFTDSGPGIPEAIGDRIFDPFFTTKDVGKGTGLGLSICYGIIEEHGGKIWVDNSFTDGARIIVELPIQSVIETDSAGGFVQPGLARSRVGKILLVDDEAAIREVVRETLKRTGHSVDTAKDGRVALRMVRQKHYDCVVTDVKMPGIDGPALHRVIREYDPDLAGSFIFISGDTVSPETRDYLSQAERPYLAKPFRLEDLETLLQQVLAGKAN